LRVPLRMARRPRGPVTTLGDMRRKDPTCPVCGIGFNVGEPVAWTVGRDRIHEACIDLARVAAPGRAKFGRWKAPAVRVFLQRTGGRLCASCLAMALSLSLDQAREIMQLVDGVAGLRLLPVTCASCLRATDALCVVPVSAPDGGRIAS
jgi:hypothetical protein